MAKRIFFSLLVLCLCTLAASAGNDKVQITRQEGKLRIEIGGQHFSDYIYEGYSRPILFPIMGPHGAKMTRHWPLAEAPDEAQDHPHHKSFWWAHGNMNGVDFWSEGKKSGKTVQTSIENVASGDVGIIKTRNKYVDVDGREIATDERILRFYSPSATKQQSSTEAAPRIFDFQITLRPSSGNLTLGDTKEGTMAIRLAETMRLKGKVGKGHIVNSERVRDAETWGKRAKWVDYYGPVNGKTVGVAIFDHPSNPRHPTWWHVRDYGLFAANPFGIHDFEQKPAGTGDFVVPAGQSVTFKYRFYIHAGDEVEGRVAEAYANYVK